MTIEYIIEICVAIDIAILGIAYPIIIDKVSNIGDKYSSQYIPVIFANEFPERKLRFKFKKAEYQISIFKLTLYATLISLLFLIFKCPPPFDWDNFFINNSAKILVLILSSTLTSFFFIWLNKIVLYNGKSTTILTHLINLYNNKSENKQNELYHLKAINDLTYYAVERQDDHLQKTLLEFYHRMLSDIRKEHNINKPIEYPADWYMLINKLNVEAVEDGNKKLKAIEHRAVSGNWLLGDDFRDIKISDQTYKWLWANIYVICDTPRLVKMFWANSNQYFNYRLRNISAEIDKEHATIKNQLEIDNRKLEQRKFFEFHYSLGGLLLYRQQYKTLKYMFEYSQSQPPRYVLLPDSTTELFFWFEHFRDEFKHDIPMDSEYYFPDLDNLGNRGQVVFWICQYIALLFIRQYSLHKYYVYQNPTAQPSLPEDLSTLTNWLDGLKFFERCLKEASENKALMSEIEFVEIVDDERENFKLFIYDLSINIAAKIGAKKLNAELSKEKIDKFYSESNRIIQSAFTKYKGIYTATDKKTGGQDSKITLMGSSILMSKSAFTEGDIPHFNFEVVFAETIANETIKRIIPNSFSLSRTKRYLINKEDLLRAFRRIINNKKNYVIVGINIDSENKTVINVPEFKGKVIYIPSKQYSHRNFFFILSKEHLPTIEHKEISEEEIKQMQLVSINKELKLYASVIDLSKPENYKLKNIWNLTTEQDNQDLKVQLAISFIATIHWKDDRQVIQLNLSSEYNEQGIQNNINDIEPLK